MTDTMDYFDTKEFEVENAVESFANLANDIAGYRLNNEARGILLNHPCRMRLTLALDALQITVDDLEGKRHG